MNKIVVKIPRKKKKVRIVGENEELNRILDKYRKQKEQRRKEKEEQERSALREKHHSELSKFREEKEREKDELAENLENATILEPPKPVFSQKFKISGSNQPIKISLDNIPEDTLTVEEVVAEVQDAYDRGFEDGKEATTAAYTGEIDKYAEWIKRIDDIIAELQQEFSKELNNFSQSVVDIAEIIAEKILEKEISKDSDNMLRQIRKGINTLDDDEIFSLIVNPEDVEALEEAKSELVSEKGRLKKTKIQADKKIKPGGCILRTSVGDIDATLERQIDKISGMIKESLSDISEEPAEDEDD